MSWEGLQYAPVAAVREKVLFRDARSARKTMLRFFLERGLFEFAEALRTLVKDSARTGAEKNERFKRILDRYAVYVTRSQAKPAAETPSDETPGTVGVPSA